MTPPIRPGLAPTSPVAPQRSPQALAAQRAFFQAAMDRAAAPSNPVPKAPAQQASGQATAPVPSRAAAGTSPEPMPRLGRYLDIRV